MTPSIVVFDIGGVLVDWQPHLAWLHELGSEAAVADFMQRTDFLTRNTRADGGESFADLSQEIDDPRDSALFRDYVSHYARTVQTPLHGTWDLIDRLQARDVPLHAITNWSHETWPADVSVHPRLAEVFGTTIVSGQEGFMKPDPRIYQTLCDRAGIAAEDCVFIDDSPKNVDGAKAAGMDAIHFSSASALEASLIERCLL